MKVAGMVQTARVGGRRVRGVPGNRAQCASRILARTLHVSISVPGIGPWAVPGAQLLRPWNDVPRTKNGKASLKLALAVIILSGLATVALTPLAKRLALAVGAMDYPSERRKVHARPVPRLGGVAIFLPVMLSLVLGFTMLQGTSRVLGLIEILGLLGASSAVFLLGVYDDIRRARAPMKLIWQIAAAGLLYLSGVRISEVWTPFGWMADLGVFALPFTLLWLVGLSNGMNLVDGIDGLAAGVAATASLTMLIISMNLGDIQMTVMAAALLGSLLGFLPFNFHPAKIFLGDCGAMFLGFFLAAVSVLGNQKSASAVAMGVPIIALGIPIFDTLLAFIRRVLRGKHPFQADRDHLHHRLLALGMSQKRAAILLYGASAFLAVMALLMITANWGVATLILLCLGLVTVAAMERVKAREFKELCRLFQYGERRRRPPRYRAMLVRNTVPLMAQCETPEALQALLEEVRKDLGLETLRVRLHGPHWQRFMNGMGELVVVETAPFRDPDLVDIAGKPSWNGRTDILVNNQAVGEIFVSKPAWKRRRTSEKDEELLQFLADGLGEWVATRQKAMEQRPIASVNQPRLPVRLMNSLFSGRSSPRYD